MKLLKCNVCFSKAMILFTNLGKHTPADTFLTKKQLRFEIPNKELCCYFCKKCFHIQLKEKIRADQKYNTINYSYTSGNSKISREYFGSYYKKINFYKKKQILEIGANDGFLIEKFKKKNKVYAVEPSKFMHRVLQKKGVISINKYFEKINRKTLNKFQKKIDLILANNVLNHSHSPTIFFNNLKKIISNNGTAIIEVPYSPWMIKNYKFDLIYHEHVNYFCLNSLNYLISQHQLYINKVMFPNYHGKMIRIFISTKNNNYKNKIINHEKKFFNSYKNNFTKFNLKIINIKNDFNKKINKIISEANKVIIGIGASAKANTFLNYMNLDNSKVDYMSDNSKYKVGKYTPGSKIKIISDEDIKKITNKKIYVFFPTWNIKSFLKKKIKKNNKNIIFL
jgi:SAM-dependent methyltransferase